MTCTRIAGGIICHQPDFQPGDQAPEGYLAWHEWAEVQHKAGLRQVARYATAIGVQKEMVMAVDAQQAARHLQGMASATELKDRMVRRILQDLAVPTDLQFALSQ